MALRELVRKAADLDVDVLRAARRVLTQELMVAAVAAHLGAERYARTTERTG